MLSVAFLLLLFMMVIFGRGGCEISSERARSQIVIKAARPGLEVYKEKFGAYPEPASPSATVTIDGKTYLVGEAACLYQALSGDGFDQIKGHSGTHFAPSASDGRVSYHEAKNITLENMPKELYAQTNGIYYIVDAYGHPIRYITAAPAGSPATMNRDTYDLWSYGEDDVNITASSQQGAAVSGSTSLDAKWIKNW